MRDPNRLRFVECELPDGLEQSLLAFEDDFDANLKPYYDRVAAFVANDAPAIIAELNSQIALRDQLLNGSQVGSLGSLAALDSSLQLTSPARDDNDPETIRIDERKLGSAGIAMINGSIFKSLPGTRLNAMRYMWDIAGGDYNFFILLCSDVAALSDNSPVLYEGGMSTGLYPFVDTGFTKLKTMGKQVSAFRHRLIWNAGVSANYAFRNKLVAFGYDSDQLNNIFAGYDPNYNYNFKAKVDSITMMIQAVTRLLFLAPKDLLRNPPWKNEAQYVELAISEFLDYRIKKYTTSSVFDLSFFKQLISGLRPQDLKELLEQRPEITDIELPQAMTSISALVEKAVTIPTSEGTLINTYMLGLPNDTRETQLQHTLYNLGYRIYQKVLPVDVNQAQRLQSLLLELVGKASFVPLFTDITAVDFTEISALFPNVNLPPAGVLVASVATATNEDPNLLKSAVSANSESSKLSTETTTSSGTEQGLPTEDTFGMILARRTEWNKNFIDCQGGASTAANSAGSVSSGTVATATSTVVSSTKGNFTRDAGTTFDQHLSYLTTQLGLKSKTIAEIRSALSNVLMADKVKGLIALNDQSFAPLLTTINSSSDLNTVVNTATQVLVAIQTKAEAKISSNPALLATEGLTTHSGVKFTGDNAIAANRRYIQQQSGTAVNPGLTTTETQKLKKTLEDGLGQNVSWLGNNTTSFNQNIKFDLSNCKPAWGKSWDDTIAMFESLGSLITKYGQKAGAWLIQQMNVIKQVLISMQDKIDSIILALQMALNNILATLERLLSVDLNLSGKLGFDNSLLKCSWGLDLGLKINLLDLLLLYLNKLLAMILGPFLGGLDILKDIIKNIICIPIKYIEGLLGAASALLGMIGCSIKDVKLPVEILELLSLIMGFFQLRQLVLRAGSDDWYSMCGKVSLQRDDFKGLSQFAAICQGPKLAALMNETMQNTLLKVSSIPFEKMPTSYGVGLP